LAQRLQNKVRKNLLTGAMIPVQPLALRRDSSLDEPAQRAMARYYRDAGVGGLAVGCSTVPLGQLYQPLLEICAAALKEKKGLAKAPLIQVAAVTGETATAVEQARTASDLGYHLALLDVDEVSDDPAEQSERFAAVAEVLPVFASASKRGTVGVSYATWRGLCDSETIAAIRLTGPTRRDMLNAVRAVRDSGLDQQIALYAGNDATAMMDLVSRFAFTANRDEPRIEVVGGLVESWGFWTRRTLDLFNEARRLMDKNLPISRALVELAIQSSDAGTAVLNAGSGYKGSTAGVLEILRRQNFIDEVMTLDPAEALTGEQISEIDRVYRDYPHLHDDPFVDLHQEDWFS
jgi:hypothetical protein